MGTADDLMKLGAASLAHDDLASAEAAGEAAVALAPKDAKAWIVLGTAYAKQHKLERAVRCFERALFLDPEDIASYTALGELLLDLGAHSRASAALEEAMKRDPNATHPAGRRARALVAKTLTHLKR